MLPLAPGPERGLCQAFSNQPQPLQTDMTAVADDDVVVHVAERLRHFNNEHASSQSASDGVGSYPDGCESNNGPLWLTGYGHWGR